MISISLFSGGTAKVRLRTRVSSVPPIISPPSSLSLSLPREEDRGEGEEPRRDGEREEEMRRKGAGSPLTIFLSFTLSFFFANLALSPTLNETVSPEQKQMSISQQEFT